jgi:hypothetical protein
MFFWGLDSSLLVRLLALRWALFRLPVPLSLLMERPEFVVAPVLSCVLLAPPPPLSSRASTVVLSKRPNMSVSQNRRLPNMCENFVQTFGFWSPTLVNLNARVDSLGRNNAANRKPAGYLSRSSPALSD